MIELQLEVDFTFEIGEKINVQENQYFLVSLCSLIISNPLLSMFGKSLEKL